MQQKTGIVFLGIVLVVIGGVILAGNAFAGFSMAKLWPLFILVPALWFFVIAFTAEQSRGILMPATMLTVLAVYFLWLNYTGWANIRTTWPIFIAAPGLGLFVMSFFVKDKSFFSGVILLGIAGCCYGFFIARSTVAVPALLIGLGIVIVIKAFIPQKK